MAKKDDVAKAAPNSDAIDITLDEFCAALSLEKVGSEMIGGFHLDARHAGLIKTSEAAFRDRFVAYSNRAIN